ncbi:MAG: methionine--tRNA ligase [Thaumarchaeota archaeon]|nr:methionine--tRNA ligase [Nitrososphaerota archaeon]
MAKWIVTSAWPYSSNVPHLGNLIGSVLSADMFARYLRMNNHSVIFVSGSDEHGTPVEIEAVKRGVRVKEYADANHRKIADLFKQWNISYDNYTRTESPIHIKFTQEHYMKIYAKGLVFQEEEKIHYCPRDNRFLPDRFVEGTCPNCGAQGARGDQCDTCGKPLDAVKLINARCAICNGPTEIRSVKQWYFDLPKLSDPLRKYVENNNRLSENALRFSLSWIEEGLKPRSLTRDTSWGIPAPFPGAEDKTIYVWMEAVLGYVSATIEHFASRNEMERWKEFWLNDSTETAFFIGKDNIPFHTIIFTGLLLASGEGYVLPGVISSTEFLQFEGKKFSKSRGIGIWIDEALELLHEDYWRYTLLSLRPETGDVNFSYDLLEEKVNVELNDKIGNFIHRTLSATQRFLGGVIKEKPVLGSQAKEILSSMEKRHMEIASNYESIKLQRAVRLTLEQAEEGNRYLNLTEPWKTYESSLQAVTESLYTSLRIVKALAVELYPVIPKSAAKAWSFVDDSPVENVKWADGASGLKFPIRVSRFKPLFSKISKEDIIRRIEEMRRQG